MTESIRASLGLAHQLFSGILVDLDDAIARRTHDGATIGAIAPIVAHAVFSEDMMVNQLVRQAEPLLLRGDWMSRTGIPGPQPMQTPDWLAANYSMDGLRAYAEAIFADTMKWLDVASPEDLQREVPTPLGYAVSGAHFLTAFGTAHLMLHAGEVAALRGTFGMTGGLPM